MAYDEELADRVRAAISASHQVTEQKMFGGLAFLIGGHMAVAVSGQGGLLVRADPADAERLLAEPGVEEMVMRDRPMRGWLRVPASAVTTKRQLERWVKIGATYATSLPPKKAAKSR